MDIALHNAVDAEAMTYRAGDPYRYVTPSRQIWPLLNASSWRERNPVLAYVCACFSELAYLHLTKRELDNPGRYKWVPSLAFQALAGAGVRFDVTTAIRLDFPNFVVVTDDFVYVGFKVRETAVVAIRGTKSLPDMLVDLIAWKRSDPATGRRVHRGFASEAEKATPLLLTHLMRLQNIREVMFTGHSLGGALAGLLHARWPAQQSRVRSLTPYVFGTPRFAECGDMRFNPVYAYRRPNDLVPHLPPRLLGYEDAGPDPQPVPASEGPWPTGWQVFGAWILRPDGPGFARLHAIELYRKYLGLGLAPDFPDLVYWQYANAIMHSEPPKAYPEPPHTR